MVAYLQFRHEVTASLVQLLAPHAAMADQWQLPPLLQPHADDCVAVTAAAWAGEQPMK